MVGRTENINTKYQNTAENNTKIPTKITVKSEVYYKKDIYEYKLIYTNILKLKILLLSHVVVGIFAVFCNR